LPEDRAKDFRFCGKGWEKARVKITERKQAI